MMSQAWAQGHPDIWHALAAMVIARDQMQLTVSLPGAHFRKPLRLVTECISVLCMYLVNEECRGNGDSHADMGGNQLRAPLFPRSYKGSTRDPRAGKLPAPKQSCGSRLEVVPSALRPPSKDQLKSLP